MLDMSGIGNQGRDKERQAEPQPASTPAITQAVTRVAEDASFVHFYLGCGHLVTNRKGELPGKHPREMKCWACSTEMGQT